MELSIVAKEAAFKLGLNPKRLKIAVQGFGNVGSMAALKFKEQGYDVVAISDIHTALYNENRINIEEAIEYKKENGGMLYGYKENGMKEITNKELLELNVDILVPAAMENQITLNNAANIKAKIVVEGANGPTTTEADEVLLKKGIFVVPDILANAGGVVVSYLEWVQNLQSIFWDIGDVYSMLAKKMLLSFEEVYSLSCNEGVTMRIAAYMLALDRVVRAKKIRGIFP